MWLYRCYSQVYVIKLLLRIIFFLLITLPGFPITNFYRFGIFTFAGINSLSWLLTVPLKCECSILIQVPKELLEKSCTSHLISYRHATYSPDLASIISLKITSIVVYNQMSCVDLDKEHLIKSVISSHGRDVPLTSPGLNIPQIFHYIHQLQQNYYLDQNNQFRLLQQYRNSQQAFLQV
jgi:hypothetical protein